MSLHVLADHMATHGRGPDSMLVHMSPQEVQALQELAMKNGGSLTINPQTGLPEAGFLDSILPIIAGIALGPAGFGLMSAGMAGVAVGGVTALATGSLEKGLMAGMGAYGGAGISGALAGAGEGAMGLAASEAAQQEALKQGLTGEARSQFLQNAVTDKLAAATPFDKLSAGFTNLGTEAGRTAALDAAGGGMGALKYGAAAIAPIMADQMVETTTKAPTTDTGYIRQKVYDPISGTYTDVGPVKASEWGSRSFSDLRRGYADGGIVALNNGGVAHFRAAGYVDDGGLQDQEFTPAPDYAITGGGGAAPPAYTDQQIQAAVDASRNQGFTNDQILQGAQANYGTDVSRFLAPAASTTPDYAITGHGTTAATTGGLDTLAANQAAATLAQNTGGAGTGLLGGVSQAVRDFAAANPDALSGATAGTTAATTGGAGTGFLSGVSQAVQNAVAANPNLFSGNTATTGGLNTLAANQAAITGAGAVTPGANNATSGTSGDSGVLTLLANQGAASVTGAATTPAADQAAARAQVATIYRNVLGRDPDAAGLDYWSSQITSGKSPESVYQDMLTAAKTYIPSGVVTADQIRNLNFADATKAYTGYQSADTGNVVDDWVRNIIGREPTAADKEQAWYKNAATNMSNPGAAAETYKQFQGYAAQSAQTAAETRAAEAAATIKAAGLTDADVFASTGMHIVDLVKVNPDLAQNLIGASQLKPGETYKPKSIADYVSMDKLVGKDFYGLGQLNQDQQAQLAIAEAKKGIAAGMSDKDIAKAVDLKYLKGFTEADIKKFIDDNHLRLINQPPNSSIIGGSGNDVIGVKTDTGAILPISTLKDGTQVVVNPTQVATTGVTTPTVLNEAARTALPVGVAGNQTATINPNGTVSMTTGTPNMPEGGYTGMTSLRDAYTKGGGSLGYTPYTPKTMAEFNAKYTNTGDTKSAYDYLMGKGPNPYKSGVGEIMRPYNETTLGMPVAGNKPYIWNQSTGKYDRNPDYVRPMRDSSGNVTYTMSQAEIKDYLGKNKDLSGQELYDWAVSNNLSAQDVADAQNVPLSKIYAQFRDAKKAADAAKKAADTTAADTTTTDKVLNHRAAGGPVGYAVGGGLGSLGSYSDGGRLLRGPGDGVSDSIPASIGQSQQPARLADGEFVVPARIVSELGNGSTEAGARKLYAMMDRVQRARGKTTGKDRVAANTSADKYLPA